MKAASVNKKNTFTPLLALTLLAVLSFIVKEYDLPVSAGYGAFIVIAFFFLAAGGGKLSLSKTKIAAAVFAAVATALVFMPYASTSLTTIGTLMSLDIAMIYILICSPDEQDVERTLRILMFFALVMSLYAIAVSVHPDVYYKLVKPLLPPESQNIIELNFKNHYGIAVGRESIVVDYYAFFGLVIAVNTLLIKGKKEKKKIGCILMIILCTLAIIVQNRKAELLTAAVVVVFLFLSNVNATGPRQRRKHTLAFFFVALLGVAAFLVLLRQGYLSRYEVFFRQLAMRSSEAGSTVDISSGRIKLWGRALELFKDHPVFGIGWGNFRNYLTDTYNVFNDGQLSNVHNNYLQILCETGAVGFLLFVPPLFYILARTFRTIRRLRLQRPGNESARIAASVSVSFQLFYLGISFIDPVWYKMFTWPFYGISVILIVYAEKALSCRYEAEIPRQRKEDGACLALND